MCDDIFYDLDLHRIRDDLNFVISRLDVKDLSDLGETSALAFNNVLTDTFVRYEKKTSDNVRRHMVDRLILIACLVNWCEWKIKKVKDYRRYLSVERSFYIKNLERVIYELRTRTHHTNQYPGEQ